MDLEEQAALAEKEGIAEIIRLLQKPEDLNKLPELIQEYDSKLQACKATLSALVQSQVEAARHGIDLLDRTHRNVIKFRACLDGIYRLCDECSSLMDNQAAIRLLSLTHGNVSKVLAEIKDIIDLPDHAETALAMLDDPANLVSAYQALTVLEGTAENAKLAWKRNNKATKHDMSSMLRYVDRVSDAAAEFEAVLWDNLREYEDLSQESPSILVDCLKVIEMQERLDKQFAKTRMEGPPPKKWRQQLLDLIASSINAKFKTLLEQAPLCGIPNKTVKYNQDGDIVIDEVRDYLGNLTCIVLVNRMTGAEEEIQDAAVLKKMDIIEEEVFDETEFIDAIVDELYAVEADLANAYDNVAPCFPPSYNIFETLFQMYHVQVAMVIDTLGQRADKLSSGASLKIMEFVSKYLETVRGFGIEEALVRLPISPITNPDLPPGLDMLMRSFIDRMEHKVTQWYNNIMVVDLEYEPKPCPNGTLRTLGVVDFFRILNEELEVIRSTDDHGEVMFRSAVTAIKLMHGFQEEQTRVIKDPEVVLSFEMFCALLNNNVECYEQALQFVEEVQSQLEGHYKDMLEVEDVCRGFLEVAKEASRRVAGAIFNDPGMSTQLGNMFSTPDWLAGRTTGTMLATLSDYMNDVQRFVEPSFVKRVAESAFEELVRRTVNIFIAGLPPVTEPLVTQMQADEDAYTTYFSEFLKPDRMAKPLQQLSDLRMLVAGDTVPLVVAAYESALSVHSGFTVDVLQKILDARGSYTPVGSSPWEKKQVKDVMTGAKDVWRKKMEGGKQAAKPEASKGFFSFFSSS